MFKNHKKSMNQTTSLSGIRPMYNIRDENDHPPVAEY